MQIDVISTEALGDRSYVVGDGQAALVVDPQRDLDRVEAVLASRNLSCALVVETHIHNDYVTGGFELARTHGCPYVVSADDEVTFDRHAVRDGDALTVGSLTVRVVATPGHTDTHLSYVVSDSADPDGAPAVFTGGSLLYGSVGRTDLVDAGRTEELTRAQFHSARRLADELPDDTAVYPTHGFGSFCSSGSASGGDGGTIGGEKERNDALVTDDEDSFVEALITNLTAYPAYYAHMAPLNRQGPPAADLTPPAVATPERLRASIEAGEWVVDLRDRTAYAAGHLGGTVGIPLDDQFSTYLGWLIPWGTPLTLIGETEDDVRTAQRDLARIGVEHLAGRAVGEVEDLLEQGAQAQSYPRVTFDHFPPEMASRIRSLGGSGASAEPAVSAGDRARVVLDVRRDDERADGAVHGSAHIPLHSLLQRIDEVPEGELWVHCATGFRASIAASLLARAGKDVVYIDDSFENAVTAGLASS